MCDKPKSICSAAASCVTIFLYSKSGPGVSSSYFYSNFSLFRASKIRIGYTLSKILVDGFLAKTSGRKVTNISYIFFKTSSIPPSYGIWRGGGDVQHLPVL